MLRKSLNQINKCLFLACCLLILSYCGTFEPRKAEPPEAASEWFSFHITPEQTMYNLKYAFIYRGNLEKYNTILHDEFVFFFDVRDVNDYGTDQKWDKETEREMLHNFHNNLTSGYDLELNLKEYPDQSDLIQADESWLFREYSFIILDSQGNEEGEFLGKIELYLVKDSNGFWKIRRWNDYRLSSDSYSWGKMKNDFAP